MLPLLPRRFLSLTVVAALAILSTFVFLNRGDVLLSSPVKVPSGWTDQFEESWENAWVGGKEKDLSVVVNEAIQEELPKSWTSGPVEAEPAIPHAKPVHDEQPAVPISNLLNDASSPLSPDGSSSKQTNVAVVETGGTNDETFAALVHAFGRQKDSHLSLYTLQQRYGIGDIINDFRLAHPLAANKSSATFARDVADGIVPDIVVSATCETDLVTLDAPLAQLLAHQRTYLFCIVHQPARWSEADLTSRLQPWIDAQLVDIVTLSPHTAHYLRTKVINRWDFNATVIVRHLAPLFPVALPDEEFPVNRISTQGSKPVLQYPIAIHGDFDASRHNYTDAFENLLVLQGRAKTVSLTLKNDTLRPLRDFTLNVFGERVPPNVPKKVKPLLNINREISFQHQYEILSRSYILLPAFASDAHSDYLHELASAAIPASLIAGVPIVASDEIIQAYAYLPRDITWTRYGGETEMKVAERVAMWSVEEHRRKKEVVQAKCRDFVRRNEEHVDEWVQIARRKVERYTWRSEMDSVNSM